VAIEWGLLAIAQNIRKKQLKKGCFCCFLPIEEEINISSQQQTNNTQDLFKQKSCLVYFEAASFQLAISYHQK